LFDSQAERGAHGGLRFCGGTCLGVLDSVSVRFAVTGTQDDAVGATEFATEIVKGKRWDNFSHSRVVFGIRQAWRMYGVVSKLEA